MIRLIAFLLALIVAANTHAAYTGNRSPYSQFYLGMLGGYGRTTWEALVPQKNGNATAMQLSTPTEVTEGGILWGAFAGYEIVPAFALEASYMRYPNAKVDFDAGSLFTWEHHLSSLNTHTEAISLMGKIMLTIPHTEIRAYSSLGPALIHRYDQIRNRWRVTPTFGAGLNYDFNEHLLGELGATYVAGFGQSELDPAEDFMPFLYNIFVGLAYRF